MKRKNTYSDEYISAFIDGELDEEERAHLLLDEQLDDELALRINETRMLKEKVQLTYANVGEQLLEKQNSACIGFLNKHRALVASLLVLAIITGVTVLPNNNADNLLMAQQLIKNTQTIPASDIATVAGSKKHIIINVSQYDPGSFSQTVSHIETLLQSRDQSLFEVEIVANGQGLKAFDKNTSPFAIQMEQLASRFDNLKIVACAKSLTQLAVTGDPVKLLDSIMITPSAAQQVAKRTTTGWLYIKI